MFAHQHNTELWHVDLGEEFWYFFLALVRSVSCKSCLTYLCALVASLFEIFDRMSEGWLMLCLS